MKKVIAPLAGILFLGASAIEERSPETPEEELERIQDRLLRQGCEESEVSKLSRGEIPYCPDPGEPE